MIHIVKSSVLAVVTLIALSASALASSLPEVTALVEQAGPAVVNISTTKTINNQGKLRDFFQQMPRKGTPFDDFFDQFDRFFGPQGPHGGPQGPQNGPQGPRDRERGPKQRSLGSGFIISRDGYIVTNNHVIDQADEVKVLLRDSDKPLSAKVVGRDPEMDLALIKIDGQKDLPYLEFGDSGALKVGEWVVAIGNPFGLQNTVTMGIVSAKGRIIGAGPFDNFIQTDASINPGNSGGPLLDLDGRVIGINTAIVASGQGIGFAIPSNMAKDIIGQLRENKSVKRGWLGVTIQNIDENTAKALDMKDTKGALLTSVIPGDPADKAGLKTGDVITAVNGESVEDTNALLRKVAALRPGEKAELTYLRKGSTSKATVSLGERDSKSVAQGEMQNGEDDTAREALLGLSLRPVNAQEAKALGLDKAQGLLVAGVEQGSAAEDADVRPGDVIVEINQSPVGSVDAFTKAVKEDGRKKGVVMLLVKRQGQNLFRTIPVTDAK
ncbi:Do family serine endopeptidase [Desulfolutivibrio sulfoxidireducens]|uniref:Do family serine endopeptidase n=1 Tax=Desulfolutivibrio sulfoxidireducens TaxID=2773299 RepID=UPI00159DBC43|nr:Do family serine endopeptidase [Desulfolutivibrio sulfoxidireducens]QLA15965.1 Do family serine endopeptidase [Desulfolutivibrio sulfoxidireducens]QLA20132.1 Do family serine endopeptidase [Desulfolutivibrio sulfoxidireducens]